MPTVRNECGIALAVAVFAMVVIGGALLIERSIPDKPGERVQRSGEQRGD